MWRFLLVVAIAMAAAAPAVAHPAPFSYLDVRVEEGGVRGTLVLHDFDVAHDLGIEPPGALMDAGFVRARRDWIVALVSTRLRLRFDGRPAKIAWGELDVLPERQSVAIAFAADGVKPATLAVDAFLFPYDPVHQTFVNVYEDGSLRHQTILHADRRSADYYTGTRQGAMAVVRTFVPAGVEHILIGPDHVLFLIGLLLLGGSVWRLAAIVTAFTIGHSITLSLAALDLVAPPPSIVEPTIALSIVFVGADNLLVRRAEALGHLRPGASAGTILGPGLEARASVRDNVAHRDIRPWVAAVFGLVHGFGFATVLKEFGLPGSALGWSLFSFNLGVEIGQLAIVIAVAAILSTVRRHSSRAADRLATVGSVVVVVAGAYWFVQRVFLTGGTL